MGSINLADIRKITAFMKQNGVLYMKNGDLEIRVSKSALKPRKQRGVKKDASIAGMGIPSQEDILMWSAPQ